MMIILRPCVAGSVKHEAESGVEQMGIHGDKQTVGDGSSPRRFEKINESEGFVYFIESPVVECVKIGFAGTDPIDRLEALQAGCPVWLELIAVIEAPARRERWIHHRLIGYQLRNEWFGVSPFVRQVIDAATGMMRPENATWCRGGEEYERWDLCRKSNSNTIEAAKNPSSDVRPSGLLPIDILTHDMDVVLHPYDDKPFDPYGLKSDPPSVRYMVPDFSEKIVETYWDYAKRMRQEAGPEVVKAKTVKGRDSRKLKLPIAKRVSGHFDFIDQHRTERKAARKRTGFPVSQGEPSLHPLSPDQ